MEESFTINIPEQHCHSSLSSGSKGSMALMTSAAIIKGCDGITFTENYDCYSGTKSRRKSVDLDEYRHRIASMRDIYDGIVKIGFGIELGMRSDPEIARKIKQDLCSYDFDLIIGSVSIVNGVDITRDKSFFKGKSKRIAYGEYFDEVLRCIDLYRGAFDVMGHLDYITQYGDYEDGKIGSFFGERIDKILKKLVEYNKGLEINTSGLTKGFDSTSPSVKIVKRFRELGGTCITFGSDAKCSKNIADHFGDAIKIAKEAGFEDVAYFQKRRPTFIKFQELQ